MNSASPGIRSRHTALACIIMIMTLLTLTAACTQDDDPKKDSKVQTGDLIPTFSITMSDGRTLTDSDFSGRGGLILFFSTGCPDCRMELPSVQGAYDAFLDTPEDIRPLFVCIARGQTDPDIAAYWSLAGLSLPYSEQSDRSVYNLFATSGIPRIYIVGPDMRVRTLYSDTSRPSAATLVSDLSSL